MLQYMEKHIKESKKLEVIKEQSLTSKIPIKPKKIKTRL